MSVIDKAVSTEDLCPEDVPPVLGVLRLEAILNTLVENKVEALKQENGKTPSLHSSPKSILQKLKFHSCPKTTLSIEDEKKKDEKRKERKDKGHGHKVVSESRQFKRQMLRQETSSPDSQILHTECPANGHQYRSASCMESSCQSHVCYCSQGPMSMQVTDDYISIKMDGFGDIETDAIIAQEEIKRARRKRRRRRKRRLKKRLALNPHLVDTLSHETEFKHLHDDELPPRAKWTIVATACLLLFMCLLLVGITLRMAPIIDEIGKKRLQRTASLEDIIYRRKKQKRRMSEPRRKSEHIIRTSDILMNKKKSSKKLTKKSTHAKTSKGSQVYDIEKGYLEHSQLDRPRQHSLSTSIPSSRKLSRQLSSQHPTKEMPRDKRRKKIIRIILGVYLFLFCVSILSVVVTLTHTSTATVADNNNSTKTLTYYTFSPNPDVR